MHLALLSNKDSYDIKSKQTNTNNDVLFVSVLKILRQLLNLDHNALDKKNTLRYHLLRTKIKDVTKPM